MQISTRFSNEIIQQNIYDIYMLRLCSINQIEFFMTMKVNSEEFMNV